MIIFLCLFGIIVIFLSIRNYSDFNEYQLVNVAIKLYMKFLVFMKTFGNLTLHYIRNWIKSPATVKRQKLIQRSKLHPTSMACLHLLWKWTRFFDWKTRNVHWMTERLNVDNTNSLYTDSNTLSLKSSKDEIKVGHISCNRPYAFDTSPTLKQRAY